MFDLIYLLLLLFLGYGFGTYLEKKHYKRIKIDENELKNIVILSKRDAKEIQLEGTKLLNGNVVISIDFFKKFVAGFINFFGGKIVVYETLLDRARREAIIRVKKQAKNLGYNCLINLRLETSSISKGTKGNVGSIEVLAYATATKML
ncbi:hypothetical protein CSA08_03455 [Candidatus Gracilibacteria bacterium]|nr:MAG: hypothetical protein CSA08_03455 [Candidatus Gracilibacteria bacterium]